MIAALALFCAALAMSAFFSGSETGFYRMTRLKLVMEAVGGDRTARILLWLANHPSLVVATTLVGNTIASDLASLAAVMGAHNMFAEGGVWAELLPPLVLAPILFVVGELLPKNLFFLAPNRLMRRVGPILAGCVVLFAPITLFIWLVSLVLKLFVKQAAQELRVTLARRELNELLVEGHEAGLLRPVQRALAQTMLAIGGRPVRDFAAPAGRVVRVTTTMSRSEILRLAQHHRRSLLPIEDPQQKRRLMGYVRTADLFLDDALELPPPRPLVELAENETFLSALGKLHAADDALGHVTSAGGKTVGFVTTQDLREALFRVQ